MNKVHKLNDLLTTCEDKVFQDYLSCHFSIISSRLHESSMKRYMFNKKSDDDDIKQTKLKSNELFKLALHMTNSYFLSIEHDSEFSLTSAFHTLQNIENATKNDRELFVKKLIIIINKLCCIEEDGCLLWPIAEYKYTVTNILVDQKTNIDNYDEEYNAKLIGKMDILNKSMIDYIFNTFDKDIQASCTGNKLEFCEQYLEKTNNAKKLECLRNPDMFWHIIKFEDNYDRIYNEKLIITSIEIFIKLAIFIDPDEVHKTFFELFLDMATKQQISHHRIKTVRRIFNQYISKFIPKCEGATKEFIERIGAHDLLKYCSAIKKYIDREKYSYPLDDDLNTSFKENYEPLPIHKYSSVGRYRKNLYAYTSQSMLKFKINSVRLNEIKTFVVIQITISNIQYCFDVLTVDGVTPLYNYSWLERLNLARQIGLTPINVTPITESAFARQTKGVVYICTSGIGFGTKFKNVVRHVSKKRHSEINLTIDDIKRPKLEFIDENDMDSDVDDF